MTIQKQSACPSFAFIISVLSVLLYCVGFFRIEVELNEQKKKINALEDVLKTNEKSLHASSPSGTFSFIILLSVKLRRLTISYSTFVEKVLVV